MDFGPSSHWAAPSPGKPPHLCVVQPSWLKPAKNYTKPWYKSSERTCYQILSDPNKVFVVNSDWKFNIRKRISYRGKLLGSKVHKNLFKVIIKLTDSSWRVFLKELIERRTAVPKTGKYFDRTRKVTYVITFKKRKDPRRHLMPPPEIIQVPPFYMEGFAENGSLTVTRNYRKKITKRSGNYGRRTTSYADITEEITISRNDSKEVELFWMLTQKHPRDWDYAMWGLLCGFLMRDSHMHYYWRLRQRYPYFKDHIRQGLAKARECYVEFYKELSARYFELFEFYPNGYINLHDGTDIDYPDPKNWIEGFLPLQKDTCPTCVELYCLINNL